MRRTLIALSLIAATAPVVAEPLSSVDYRKFSADALMLMRPGVAPEDREPFREAFLEKLTAMSPGEYGAFQKKAMEYIATLDEAGRAELMRDLMAHMEQMSPEQLLMVSRQLKDTPAMPAAPGAAPGVPPTQAGIRSAPGASVANVRAATPSAPPSYAAPHWAPPAYAQAYPAYAPAYPQPAYGYPQGYTQPAYAAPPAYAQPSYGSAYGYAPAYPGYGYPGWR